MSKKIFYIYNPKTLTYERVYPSLRQRIIVVLRHLFIGSILSIGVIVAFYFWFGSPKEELLKMENEQMQTQYKVLSKRVDAALEVLSDLQQRDDNMYRVILQAEPVNDEIRIIGHNNLIDFIGKRCCQFICCRQNTPVAISVFHINQHIGHFCDLFFYAPNENDGSQHSHNSNHNGQENDDFHIGYTSLLKR